MKRDLQPLAGLRVVELPHDFPGAICGMLLADLGAEVILIENTGAPPAYDRASAQFVAYNRNKRSAALDYGTDAGRRAIIALVAEADAIVESFVPGVADRLGVGRAALTAANPALVYCSVTAFGQTGPLATKNPADLVVQALTGAMDVTGEPGRPPVVMGLPLGGEVAGLLGAIAILAAVARRERDGQGAHIDVSAFDASLAMLSYMAGIYFATGRNAQRLGSAHPTIAPYCAFKTSDSYVVAAPFTQTFWRKFCKSIGRDDLPENPQFKSFGDRLANRDALQAIIDPILAAKTLEEWRAALTAGDVPNGPVNTVAEALAMEQTKARGMIAQIPDPRQSGRMLDTLGTPFHFDFAGAAAFQPRYRGVPAAGEHAAARFESPRKRSRGAATPLGPGGLALEGVRVLDLTRMFAGPFCGQLLADLGAEVIKVEEPRVGDPTRRNIPMINGESTYYMAVNRGKKSIALDLKLPADKDAFIELLATADVVVENFRPGVMERLGLGYADLRAVKPDIVLLAMSGFGHTGPLKDKISFDLVNQAMAGTMAITGEAGRPPVRIGYPAGDLSGGIFGTFAVLAALHARRMEGVGAKIDLSLHDLMVSLLGEHAQHYFMTGDCPQALGSSHRRIVPHRVYRSADAWIVLVAADDRAWQALAGVIDRPSLATDARFATACARRANRAALDAAIERAIAAKPAAHWVAACDAAGVGCARVLTMGEALDSAHASARGDVIAFEHPIAGRCRAVGMGIFFDGRLALAPLPPPALGEHNSAVLGGRVATSRTGDSASTG